MTLRGEPDLLEEQSKYKSDWKCPLKYGSWIHCEKILDSGLKEHETFPRITRFLPIFPMRDKYESMEIKGN